MGNTHTHAPVPILDARGATDERLASERRHADRMLDRKLAKHEQRADEKIEQAREAADQSLAQASAEASAQVSAVVPEAEAAVETVVEQAEQALAAERERVDEAKQRERDQAKRAFMDVLAEERQETDIALASERNTSDFLVHSRDDVLAMISHDLRNLVGAIRLRLVRLKKQLPEELSRVLQMTEELQENCVIMERWAGDLVDLSSMDAGVLGLRRDLHPPAELVEEPVKAFLPTALDKGIQLHVEMCEEEPLVLCDRDRIVQVLGNLLGNATKFTPPGGRIVIRCELMAEDVRFSVSDTGPGIARAERSKVFERRWHTDVRRGGGVGLGLYISKHIVDSHGGRVWVESAEGQGSTFYFTLPAQKA